MIKKILLGLALLASLSVTVSVAADKWKEAGKVLDAENQCVAGLIAQEVERINIATGNGTCWEEENGYYQ